MHHFLFLVSLAFSCLQIYELTLGTAELQKDSATSLINEAHISQPACTAIQLAITDLLRSWGVSPTAVAGHSSGEIGAAYAAGILPLESCMAISYHRGMAVIDFRKNHPGLKGSMMAVGCTAEEIDPLIAQLGTGNAKIACFNSPTSLTISGDRVAIDELQNLMEEKQIFNRKLQVDVAYHSHHMNLAAKYYRKTLQSLDHPKLTSVKFHSSLLGHVVDGSQLDPSYWVDNLTQSVRFSEALTSMCAPTDSHKTGVNMIVEIGPHSALAGPVKQILKACGPDALKISYASVLVRNRDAVETALELAASFFLKGTALDLGAINLPIPGKQPTLLVDMPRYPWNHKTRYWHESRMMQYHKNRPITRNDLLGSLANYSNDMEPTWRNLLRIDDIPWLRHHQIQSLTLFPMSGFLSMAIEAASQRAALRNIQYDDFELRDVSVNTPLVIADDDIEMTLQLRPHQEDILVASDAWDEFRIHSWTTTKGWTEHCRGHIAVKSNAGSSVGRLQSDAHQTKNYKMTVVDKTKLYDSLSELGVSYGPSFQGMNDCQASNTCSIAKITTVDTAHEMPNGFQTNMTIHPAFLEQLIEMYWPILGAGRTGLDTVYLPSYIGHMVISRRITELTKMPGDSLLAFCNASPALAHPKPFQASMFATATGDTKETLIKVNLLTVSPILENSGSSETEPHRELCYKLDWEPILESSQPNGISNGTSKHSNGVTNGTPNGVLNGSSRDSKEFHDLPREDVAIIRGDSEGQIRLASKLADVLEHLSGKRPAINTLSDSKIEGELCVFLAEIENPLLASLTPVQFKTLQSVLMNAQGTFWVVRGAYIDSMNPDTNMVTGLSRSIRSETSQKFATLDLDAEAALNEAGTVQAILKVFKATFAPETRPNCEVEFIERKGSFFTPRIINDAEMNAYVHKQTKGSVLELTKFAQDGRALEMVIGTPGKWETLHFVDQVMEEPLSDDEIEIEVKAIGLNSRDALAAMGQLDHLDFGLECSGVVTKAGSGVTEHVVGSRISGISVSSGVFSTYARMKAAYSFKIGDQMTFESAASIPMAYYKAYYSLVDLGRLQADESLLIHGADSAAGSAAISLAQMVGADLFVTVRSVEAGETLKRAYGLADNQILSIHDIQVQKKNDKFDLVLKCQSTDSDTLRALWDSVGGFGRFVEIEKQGASSRLQTSDLENNRSFMSIELISLATERPKVMKRLIRDISQLFNEGKIGPIAQTTVFPISDVETAFRLLQSGKFEGKLVVSPQPDDMVKVRSPDSSHIHMNIGQLITF
jgi:NADPH:quinone reductase-like Zn-dependent oxidoreductase/malonyl CoA-acyl carrier protein transacylase